MIDLPQIAVVDFFLKISITSVGRNNMCSLSSSAVSTFSNYIHTGKLCMTPVPDSLADLNRKKTTTTNLETEKTFFFGTQGQCRSFHISWRLVIFKSYMFCLVTV